MVLERQGILENDILNYHNGSETIVSALDDISVKLINELKKFIYDSADKPNIRTEDWQKSNLYLRKSVVHRSDTFHKFERWGLFIVTEL